MALANDADEIRRRLEDQIEGVLDTYYPGWVKRGRKAYLTPKSMKDLGSFQVNLDGARRGQWYRFSQQVGGGAVELISYALTNGPKSYEIAFREARAFLGMSNDRVDDERAKRRREEDRRASDERRRAAEAEEAKRRARRARTAGDVWEQCTPIAGTLAETYLRGRGLPVPPEGWPAVLGFHKGLEYELGSEWENGEKVADGPVFPCLVARVDDVAGDLIAVWRIFLNPATAGKAPVESPKVGMGPARGGAIRIGGVAAKIGVAEGVETALAAWALNGFRFPVWPCMSTSGIVNFEVPPEVESLVIFPDGDPPLRREGHVFVASEPAGRKAARQLAERVSKAGGVKVVTAPEPATGLDYLNIYLSSVREGA